MPKHQRAILGGQPCLKLMDYVSLVQAWPEITEKSFEGIKILNWWSNNRQQQKISLQFLTFSEVLHVVMFGAHQRLFHTKCKELKLIFLIL